MLGAAVEDDPLPQDPCARVKRLPVTVSRPRVLTPVETERLRLEMQTLRDVALLGFWHTRGYSRRRRSRWQDVGPVLVIDQHGRTATHGDQDAPAAYG